jgi:hypothetical protein
MFIQEFDNGVKPFFVENGYQGCFYRLERGHVSVGFYLRKGKIVGLKTPDMSQKSAHLACKDQLGSGGSKF